MRRLPLLLMLLAAAGPAAAAPASKKPPRGVYLRYDPAPQAPPPVRATPAPTGRLALSGLTGLTGLPPVSDPGGQCRLRCARERYACEAGGDDCAPPWAACLRPCGAASAR